ncbi:MAG: T9SS type A sorting domain-containing protein, partial [Bacteroidota bacterium]
YITQIRFVPGASVVATDFTLKVWEGPDAGTLLYEEALSGLILGSWNEITLATPVAIDVTQELWFGYTVNSTDGDFPAAYDAGPAVAGYGDMITLDGIAWDPISSLGTQFDLNWNLQAFVGDVTDGSSNPMTYAEDKTVYTNSSGILVGHNTASHVSIDITESARELTGYNIYWNSEHQGYAFLDFTEDTFYIHLEAYPFVFGFLQCYYVTAVYEDCEPASDEACWLVPIGILNTELSDEISVYPNPARDILNITSSSDITHVTVMNYLGQVVYNQKLVEDNDLQIGVTAYEAGVYMVKVETSIGIYVKKIIVVQ